MIKKLILFSLFLVCYTLGFAQPGAIAPSAIKGGVADSTTLTGVAAGATVMYFNKQLGQWIVYEGTTRKRAFPGLFTGTNRGLVPASGGSSADVLHGDGSWSPPAGGVSGGGTVNELAYWTGSTSLGTLPVATYPSLTELSYVKTLGGPVQAQIDGKQATLVSGTNIKTVGGTSLLGSGDIPVGTGTVTSISQSFTGGLISVGGSPVTTSGTLALTVAGTSGGIVYFSSASTWASSGALTANALMIGGGAGSAPSTTTTAAGLLTWFGTPSWTNFSALITGTSPYLTVASPAYTGTLTLGTLSYSDTDIMASLQSSTNNYNQFILQNTNSGSSASTNFIVSNDLGTATTHYVEVGKNSSGYTGSGAFSVANMSYLDDKTDELAIGTLANKTLHFATNDTDRLTIGGSGTITLVAFTTANGILYTNGSGVLTQSTALPNGITATTQSASDNSTKVATTAYVDASAAAGSFRKLTGTSTMTGTVTDVFGSNPWLVTTANTTGTGIDISNSTLTTGNLFNISVTSTAAASSTQTALSVSQSGTSLTSNQVTYAGYFTNTKGVAANNPTNVALYSNSSGPVDGSTGQSLGLVVEGVKILFGDSPSSSLVNDAGYNRLIVKGRGNTVNTGSTFYNSSSQLVFRIKDSGNIQIGTAGASIYTQDQTSPTITGTGFAYETPGTSSSNVYMHLFTHSSGLGLTSSATITSMALRQFTVSASSGSAGVYTAFQNKPTYNFTSSFTGTAIGFDYSPILTSVTGLTNIAYRATSGSFVIGTTALAATTVRFEQWGIGTTTGINSVWKNSSGTAKLTLLDDGSLSAGNIINWQTGIGAITHLLGPTDQTFLISTPNGGTVASQILNLTTGANNSSGGNSTGAINISTGIPAHANSPTSGAITIQSGDTNGTTSGAITITTGIVGHSGAVTFTTGSPASQSSAAYNAGIHNIKTGNGATTTSSSAVASGNGGAINIISGNAGSVTTASGSSTAGNGGTINYTSGNGGANGGTGGGTTQVGGNAGALIFTSGNGGSATGASGTRNGGNAGDISFIAGAAGTGASANGLAGSLFFKVNTTSTVIQAAYNSSAPKLGFFAVTPVAQQTGNIVTALSNLGLVTSGTIPGTQLVGTTTNDDATAGNIGEETNSTVSTYANYTATATYQNITSITLSAGDWDLSAFFTYSSNGATITAASNAVFVISTTTASAAGATEGKNISYVPQAALLGTSLFSDSIAPYRVSLSGSTTYYLNTQATFTIGNPQCVGTIRARRIR